MTELFSKRGMRDKIYFMLVSVMLAPLTADAGDVCQEAEKAQYISEGAMAVDVAVKEGMDRICNANPGSYQCAIVSTVLLKANRVTAEKIAAAKALTEVCMKQIK